MALYPLPPSSNESVIDNGRSVWQMAMHAVSSFFVTTCPANVVCLTQGRFPEDSIAKGTRRQSRTVKEEYDFYFFSTFFVLFLHARKRAAGVDLQCRTGASACLASSTWPSKANQYLQWIDCSHIACTSRHFSWTSSRSRNDLRHFMRFALICASAAVRSADGRA